MKLIIGSIIFQRIEKNGVRVRCESEGFSNECIMEFNSRGAQCTTNSTKVKLTTPGNYFWHNFENQNQQKRKQKCFEMI